MTHVKAKLVFAFTALVLGVSYLLYAGLSSGWVYYLDVDQLMDGTPRVGQAVRLCGEVDPENLQLNSAALTASFTLRGKDHTVPVVYQGVIPDNMKGDIEVVVEGALNAQGVFEAHVLMTKCASKYDEKHQQRIEEVKS